MDTTTTPTRQRVWVTTAEACAALGMRRETLRQLRLRGVLTPGKHYRRIRLTDLMAYKHGIDQQRAAALDELAAQAQELGIGY